MLTPENHEQDYSAPEASSLYYGQAILLMIGLVKMFAFHAVTSTFDNDTYVIRGLVLILGPLCIDATLKTM